jgi:RNA-directed DNA polymerase
VSLATPDKIRTLQRKLYLKAKQEPSFRFYQLYDKVWREDILRHAYLLCKSNGGASGVDGVSFDQIESAGREQWLARLGKELHDKTYKPDPVRRVMIPKPGGNGERPLGIPTLRDRVAQTAAVLVLEPIFEADFLDEAYGYRPKRSAAEAVKAVHQSLKEGYTDVVDADLSKYFDTIPHRELMKSVARRIVDRQMLRLIRMWLKVPVEERDERGNKRMSGGRRSKAGTPQGGVISPLLANIYMHRFLRYWHQSGKGEQLRARIVNYADDFVILCRRSSQAAASEAMEWTREVMARLGLTLNATKTCVRDAWKQTFDFLGYTFGQQMVYSGNGHRGMDARPSHKSVLRVKRKLHEVLRPWNVAAWPEVAQRVNRITAGWSNYFSHGTVYFAYRTLDHHLYDRVRHFLRRRHKLKSSGTRLLPKGVKSLRQWGIVRLLDVLSSRRAAAVAYALG